MSTKLTMPAAHVRPTSGVLLPRHAVECDAVDVRARIVAGPQSRLCLAPAGRLLLSQELHKYDAVVGSLPLRTSESVVQRAASSWMPCIFGLSIRGSQARILPAALHSTVNQAFAVWECSAEPFSACRVTEALCATTGPTSQNLGALEEGCISDRRKGSTGWAVASCAKDACLAGCFVLATSFGG